MKPGTKMKKLPPLVIKIIKVCLLLVSLQHLVCSVNAVQIRPLTTICPDLTTGYGDGDADGVYKNIYGVSDRQDCIRQCRQITGVNAVTFNTHSDSKCVCRGGITQVDVDGTNWQSCLLPEIIDCRYQYSNWSTCTVTCGGGTRTRSKTISRQANQYGEQCLGAEDETKACNDKECPMTRRRTNNRQADLYGEQCHGAEEETKACNDKECHIDCEPVYSTWSGCSATCGPGSQIQISTNCDSSPVYRHKICYSRECQQSQDFDCNALQVILTPSQSETRLNLKVTMTRNPKRESSIDSQTVQIVNLYHPDNGAENSWLMKDNDLSIRPIYFEDEIISSFDPSDSCKADATNCSVIFKQLKLKQNYKITLVIREGIIGEVNRTISWYCPQSDFLFNTWQCSDNTSILATSLCDGEVHCSNDEDPAICRGGDHIFYPGLVI